MDLKNNIKVMGTFKKTVNGLYTAITVIRVIAVVFLILQTILLLTENKVSVSSAQNPFGKLNS